MTIEYPRGGCALCGHEDLLGRLSEIAFASGVLCIVPGKWSRYAGEPWAFFGSRETGARLCDSCFMGFIERGEVRRCDL